MHIVVIGYGPVGARFVDELLPEVQNGNIQLTIIGAEAADPYNRVMVAEYAAGEVSLADITLHDPEDAKSAGARVFQGTRALSIDKKLHTVALETGEIITYDRLVLATGARANVPTLGGLSRRERDVVSILKSSQDTIGTDDSLPPGICVMRDLEDAERVATAFREKQRIIVLGGGVLGLEFALLGAKTGSEVTVVYNGTHPMPRNLDVGGGVTLAKTIQNVGVSVLPHSRAEAVSYRKDEYGQRYFDALITADGKHIHADMLVLSCGVGARTELAVKAGLRTSSGILVDFNLESWSHPHIFAIGDCAHLADPKDDNYEKGRVPGGPSGLVGPGWRQAEWLASRLKAEVLGKPFDVPPPVEKSSVVTLKGDDVNAVSVGKVNLEPWQAPMAGQDLDTSDEADLQVSQWADPGHGQYVKMVTHDGVLKGFVAVGMPRAAAELTLLYDAKSELPADRSIILRLDGPDAVSQSEGDKFAPTAIVCTCNGVSVEKIHQAACEGNVTVACIGKATRAGTGCGGCKDRIAEVLEHFKNDLPAEAGV